MSGSTQRTVCAKASIKPLSESTHSTCARAPASHSKPGAPRKPALKTSPSSMLSPRTARSANAGQRDASTIRARSYGSSWTAALRRTTRQQAYTMSSSAAATSTAIAVRCDAPAPLEGATAIWLRPAESCDTRCCATCRACEPSDTRGLPPILYPSRCLSSRSSEPYGTDGAALALEGVATAATSSSLPSRGSAPESPDFCDCCATGISSYSGDPGRGAAAGVGRAAACDSRPLRRAARLLTSCAAHAFTSASLGGGSSGVKRRSPLAAGPTGAGAEPKRLGG